MKTFALVDENNVVLNVALFEDDQTPTDLGWSGWHETSVELTKNVAGPDFIFVPEADGYPSGLFYNPTSLTGWVLDANYEWQPPIPKPEGWSQEEIDAGIPVWGHPGMEAVYHEEKWYWDNATENWAEAGVYEGSLRIDQPQEEG